jgi:Uma2 family endonuclease
MDVGPGVRVGSYEVVAPVGRGGMADRYRAIGPIADSARQGQRAITELATLRVSNAHVQGLTAGMPLATTMYNRCEDGAMAQQTRAITADELLRMPDDGYKYELVAGRLVKMTPPGTLHGVVALRLGAAILSYVDQHGLGVVLVESGFKLASNPDTVRGPDVSFVVRSRVQAEGIPRGYWRGAPDLAVEVLSPDDVRSEISAKIEQYLETGVRQVWFVEPSARRVTVYRPDASPQVLSETDTLNGGDLLPGFEYPVARLFAFDV